MADRPRGRWRLMTPASGLGSAGVSIIEIRSDAADRLLAELGVGALEVGQRRLVWRDDAKESVVARSGHDRVLVMPHAGAAVLRLIRARLTDAGVAEADDPAPDELALDGLDQLAAEAVWRVASDAGARLALEQPDRWRASGLDPADTDDAMRDRARVLRRLVEPPTVALVGAPNIGKSTLTNALAGRSVAMVADEPGVTRDHLGVFVDLDGLIVRWLDTPGVAGGPADEAGRLALGAARQADLVLLAGDPITPAPDGLGLPRGLRVRLRDDLDGQFARDAVDLSLSVQRHDPLDPLVVAAREALVPASAIEDPTPWAFWLSVWPDRVWEAGRSPSLKSSS